MQLTMQQQLRAQQALMQAQLRAAQAQVQQYQEQVNLLLYVSLRLHTIFMPRARCCYNHN